MLDALPELPSVTAPDPEWDWYNLDELNKLFAAARNPEELALQMFAAKTGARPGEQRAFGKGDIDWHNHLVIFRRSIPANGSAVGPTKSKKMRRVPMTPDLEAVLKAIKHLRSDLVFCNQDGSRLSMSQLHEPLWWCCKKAGLRKVRWYDLRHSFASNLVAEGVPLPRVQEWMGHSTIMMTMRYAHLAPDGGRDLIAVLDGQNSEKSGLTMVRQGGRTC